MKNRHRVAFIGAGKPWKTEGATGFGMAYSHARAYQRTGSCELVAVADLSAENGSTFAGVNGIPRTYADYREMLAAEKPEIVSICTWPHLHAPMTVDCANSGVLAVHCEKPMASTWGLAKQMAATCEERRVQLTFNHQRRYLQPFQEARRLLADGAVGKLQRLEAACGDIIDWGTHWIDMLFFFNGETPAEWVIGQVDSRTERKVFGLPTENQALCHFKFKNGVRAWVTTGFEADIGCAIRASGTEGVIEIGWGEPWLRVRLAGDTGWREIPVEEGIHGDAGIDRAIADLVSSLETGETPQVSSKYALQTTEVIFATYESSRRRGRVDLPLLAEDNALVAMIEAGEVGPRAQPR